MSLFGSDDDKKSDSKKDDEWKPWGEPEKVR